MRLVLAGLAEIEAECCTVQCLCAAKTLLVPVWAGASNHQNIAVCTRSFSRGQLQLLAAVMGISAVGLA